MALYLELVESVRQDISVFPTHRAKAFFFASSVQPTRTPTTTDPNTRTNTQTDRQTHAHTLGTEAQALVLDCFFTGVFTVFRPVPPDMDVSAHGRVGFPRRCILSPWSSLARLLLKMRDQSLALVVAPRLATLGTVCCAGGTGAAAFQPSLQRTCNCRADAQAKRTP